MPKIVKLSEEEQNAIVMQLYALATKFAERLIRACYREDIVHDLLVRWLDRLRAGTWDIAPEHLSQFVEDAILDRRVEHYRRRRRSLHRDRVHLEFVADAPREWMSQDLKIEEDRLSEFASRVKSTLPRKCVRAHHMVRDDGMSYADVAKKLRVAPSDVHEYVKTVHRAFRKAMPGAGIEPRAPRRGGRPKRPSGRARRDARYRRRPLAHPKHAVANRSHKGVSRTKRAAHASRLKTAASRPVAGWSHSDTIASQPVAHASHPETSANRPVAHSTHPEATASRPVEPQSRRETQESRPTSN